MPARSRATPKRRRPRPKKKPAAVSLFRRSVALYFQPLAAVFSAARTHWQSLALVGVFAAAAAGFWKYRQAQQTVVAVTASPAPAALADVQRIMTGDAAPRDARELAAVLEALAAAVETETELVTTTARFRAAVDVALGAVFAGRLQGKYQGLGTLIETKTQAVAGLDVRTLQTADRGQLVGVLRDLAAAFSLVAQGAK